MSLSLYVIEVEKPRCVRCELILRSVFLCHVYFSAVARELLNVVLVSCHILVSGEGNGSIPSLRISLEARS